MPSFAEPGAERIERRRRFHRILFDWCLAHAGKSQENQSNDGAANWLLLAARMADHFGCGQLASSSLEKAGLALAARIPLPAPAPRRPGPRRWLHVVSIAYAVGGHSTMLRRWIESDDSGDEHHLALTFITDLAVAELGRAVAARGGRVTTLGSLPGPMEKAAALRELAWREADRVVLHVHMWDVIPLIAFGVPGGPPVLVLNHADHTFWVGVRIADRVINLRPAGADLAARLRGVARNLVLPIPLPDPIDPSAAARERRAIRERLGIPASAILFLTIGSGFKYLPVGSLDFLAMAQRLLSALPDAYLVAVGPSRESPGWEAAAQAVGGRIIPVGSQYPVTGYHAAADIYLEGFPFDSATALLEAALAGLPAVRIPASAVLPFSAHHFPLSVVVQPADVEAYLAQALALGASAELRASTSARLKTAVTSLHCGDAWRGKLAELKQAVPESHGTYDVSPVELPLELDRFWTTFLLRRYPRHPLVLALWQAADLGLDARVDFALARTAGSIDRGLNPGRLIGWLLWMSGGLACRIFRLAWRVRRQT